ncbi:MAG: site-2 protease family protein, partial [Myxococcota bacterium]
MTRTCSSCGTAAPEHFVACPKCHALFHAQRLAELHADAEARAQQGDALGALERLRAMLPLLPPASTQAGGVRARIATLEGGATATPPRRGWLAALAAGVVALVTKGKLLLLGLTKLPTLLTFVASLLLRGDASVGPWLVVLGSIYVHEMGHTFAFWRYGIQVSAPMFVPGFGAFVRGASYPQHPSAVGDVALSGPLWGAIAGVGVLVTGWLGGWSWLIGAAVLVAEVNVFNLFPVWQLDGSRAVAVLSRAQTLWLAVVALVGGALASSPMALLAGAGLLG